MEARSSTAGRPADEIPFVDLKRQYGTIKAEIDAAVAAAIASAQYVLGREVSLFEEEFAAYCEAEHCVGVASGTAALDLAYEAIGVGPGDEVIAPANTFIATILPVVRRGARPVLVDCDDYGQIDTAAAAAAVTERTKAVTGVHLYGHPCEADELLRLCEQHGLRFVEDAAQAHGARYRGRRCGSLGHVAAFSFYPGKNLGAYGDAGAVVTDDPEVVERIRILRDLGQERKYVHVLAGTNERLDTLQAAILRVKLRYLDGWNDLRRAHAATYGRLLRNVELPRSAPWAEPVWHLYVVRAQAGDELRQALTDAGVQSGLHYPIPLHRQPALDFLGYPEDAFPITDEWARTLLSLPMFPELTHEELERVAGVVAGSVQRAA